MGLVRLISGCVLIFSVSYIKDEIYFSRFILLIFIFVISIFLLILSPNLIRLLLGWDGLGVTSYLLVIFYQSSKSYNAGMITALTNRLGDVGLLVSISLLMVNGNWTFVFDYSRSIAYPEIVVFLIFVSACTKRAQLPFSSWLPAAIAAPTPVSALVHSSTLVTAGVYLLIRMDRILSNYTMTADFLMVIGILTIILAGVSALFEIDIKKIIALSTLSQLGVIIISIGSGKPLLAYLHLLSHAFFKAILFMCAGYVIHNMREYQDIRKIGAGQSSILLVLSIIIVANLSLCGLPFLRGFYSKDLILELMIIKSINLLLLSLLVLGTSLTVLYSCRLSLLLCSGVRISGCWFSVDEKDIYIVLGIIILLPYSICFGIVLSWLLVLPSVIFIPLWIKSLILFTIFIRVCLAIYLLYVGQPRLSGIFFWFSGNMWFLPLTLSTTNRIYSLSYSNKLNYFSEHSWVEILVFKYYGYLFYLKDFGSYLRISVRGFIMKPVLIFILSFIYLILI